MMIETGMNRFEFIDTKPEKSSFLQDVISGFEKPQKTIPSKYLYDQTGSELFEQITELEEYYPTRTEVSILMDNKNEIAGLLGENIHLIEFGSGSSRKVRILLDALSNLQRYLPVDISREFLYQEAQSLSTEYPDIRITAICGDYTSQLKLPEDLEGKKVVFFPGSTIGNFSPDEMDQFFLKVNSILSPGDGLLIGVDTKKDVSVLHAAYNDSIGITAKFNMNLLERVNRELLADINPRDFIHRAFYNEDVGRIEMHLKSKRSQKFTIGGRGYSIRKGETIHTENSYKFSNGEFQEVVGRFGFTPIRVWTDKLENFSIHYFEMSE